MCVYYGLFLTPTLLRFLPSPCSSLLLFDVSQMSQKASAYGTQPRPGGAGGDAPKKRRKKKKRILNDAQSQRLNDLQARTYMDSLLMKHIAASDVRPAYEAKITPEGLTDAIKHYKTSLQQVSGHAELVDAFVETKKWLDDEAWKEECLQWKERQYREELYGEKETFDPNTYDDEDEDEDDENEEGGH